MSVSLPRAAAWPGRRRRPVDPVVVPPDPRAVLPAPLDPALEAIRSELAGHRHRLWFRRIVRRAWIALALIAILETALWTVARFVPLEAAPVIAAAIPILVALVLLIAVVRARPSVGEVALAVDVEGALGDRVSSALELAVGYPSSATPPAEDLDLDASVAALDEAAETDRFVRRQRRDALTTLRTAPRLFKPRFSRNPAIATLAAVALIVPVLALPNPQTAVIAQQRQVREAAERQAERIEAVARDLQDKGRTADDPRLLVPACAAVFVAIWIEKGMGLIVPAFVPSPLGELVEYAPTRDEVLVCLGIWAFGLLLYTIFVRVTIPVLSGRLTIDRLYHPDYTRRVPAPDRTPAAEAHP